MERKIILLPAGVDDFDLLIDWADSAYVLQQFSGSVFSFPLTRAQLVDNLSDVKRTAFMAFDLSLGKKVGYAEMYKIDKRTLKFARLIIGANYRGKGYGSAMVSALLAVAFVKLKARQVQLRVYEQNTAALLCYEKNGFVRTSTFVTSRGCDGNVWTSVGMVQHVEDWVQNQLKMEPLTI